MLVAMNPAALKTNVGDLIPGGIADRQQRRLHAAEPQQGGVHVEPARRTARSRRITSSRCRSARSTRGPLEGLGHDQPRRPTAARTSSPWAWCSGCTSGRWTRRSRWIDQKFGKPPGRRRGQHARPQGRLRLRRDDRDVPHDTTACRRRSSRRASTATSPATRRPASGFLTAVEAREARRCSTAATRSRRRATSSTSCRRYKRFGVKTFQAEDEIAAIGAAIGAAFGGALGLTGTQRPGHRAQVARRSASR